MTLDEVITTILINPRDLIITKAIGRGDNQISGVDTDGRGDNHISGIDKDGRGDNQISGVDKSWYFN